jgi:hypothetical protein
MPSCRSNLCGGARSKFVHPPEERSSRFRQAPLALKLLEHTLRPLDGALRTAAFCFPALDPGQNPLVSDLARGPALASRAVSAFLQPIFGQCALDEGVTVIMRLGVRIDAALLISSNAGLLAAAAPPPFTPPHAGAIDLRPYVLV